MTEDLLFDLEFSSEQEFIYQAGHNKGVTLVALKITRCPFLSADAKQLYTTIVSYAFGQKTECYPSQNTLMFQLGWSKNTLYKYLKELEDGEFISRKSRPSDKTIRYRINDLHNNRLLIHSEVLWTVAGSRLLMSKFADYSKSELCNEVASSSEDVSSFAERIEEFFKGEVSSPPQETVGRKRPVVVPTDGIGRETGDEKRKKKVPRSEKPVDDWTALDFINYFCEEHERIHKFPVIPVKGDNGVMKQLMDEKGDKEVVKTNIDNFLSLEVDTFKPRTIKQFRWRNNQMVLDEFRLTGNLPKSKKPKPQLSEGGFDDIFKGSGGSD